METLLDDPTGTLSGIAVANNGGKKKKPKKKKKVVDPNAPPKPKRKTGLNKPLILSDALSELMDGDKELSRPELVRKLWDYIKKNNLQDPADRRYILCDDKLKKIFNQDRVNSFGMNKDLTAHLTKKEEPITGPEEISETAIVAETNLSSSSTTLTDSKDDIVASCVNNNSNSGGNHVSAITADTNTTTTASSTTPSVITPTAPTTSTATPPLSNTTTTTETGTLNVKLETL
ncbi:SWIB-domain-containing protein [Backusella circina FSU 941]|nr:SWIB-domain-containing protein [Backusella circina FSU 941]